MKKRKIENVQCNKRYANINLNESGIPVDTSTITEKCELFQFPIEILFIRRRKKNSRRKQKIE